MRRKATVLLLALILCMSLVVPAVAANPAIIPITTIVFSPSTFSEYTHTDAQSPDYLEIELTNVYDRFDLTITEGNQDEGELLGSYELHLYLGEGGAVKFTHDISGHLIGDMDNQVIASIDAKAGETIRLEDLITKRKNQLGQHGVVEGWDPSPNRIITYVPNGLIDGMAMQIVVFFAPASKAIADLYDGGNANARALSTIVKASPAPDQPSSWAVEQVNAAIAAKLVPQELQSKYKQPITRAEFCSLAVALYESLAKNVITERVTFADTADINVEKAAAMGVVSGVGNNKFDPAGKLTREQAAVMLAALAKAVDKPLPETAATFVDTSKISSWAAVQVGQIQAAGIMGGVGNNTFAPKDPYTREQSIITIMKLYNALKQ